ncbi:MAG: hypothetical protein ACOYYU_04390 [Chloroflexota bacterium]
MSRKNILFASITGIFLILSCAVPPMVAPQPVPTTDPNRLSTLVAGTASVLMTQTARAAGLLVTPTETPYATPTRPVSGSVLEVQPDGSTYFADAVTGIEMLLPPGWMALRIGEQEYYSAWADETSQRLGFTNILTNFSGQDPNVVRLIALDTQDGHLQNVASCNIILQTGHPYTLDEGVGIQLEHHRTIFKDVDVISQNKGEITAGIPAVIVETSYTGVSFSTGQEVRVYEKFILFQANGKVTSLKLEALDELRAVMTSQFDQVLAGLVFFTP